VEVDAAHWDALLHALGVTDVYYSRGYAGASAVLAEGTPVLLHLAGRGGDVLFPCLVREEPHDVVTPYGYGGPLGVGRNPPIDDFANAYEAWCHGRGIVTSFVVHHPLFATQALSGRLGFHRVALGGTVAWPLAEPELEARMHKHHRRMVRRAEARGLSASADAAPEALSGFVALYEAAMRRLDAAPFYLFPPAYWEAMQREVALTLVEVRDPEGGLVAGVLGMGEPPWLHYHLGAAAEAARGTGASHLALLTLAQAGKDGGYDTLHLGGGVGGRADSLLEFKLRFAPDGLIGSELGKAVHDVAAYARLTGEDSVDWESFFPAYRAPP